MAQQGPINKFVVRRVNVTQPGVQATLLRCVTTPSSSRRPFRNDLSATLHFSIIAVLLQLFSLLEGSCCRGRWLRSTEELNLHPSEAMSRHIGDSVMTRGANGHAKRGRSTRGGLFLKLERLLRRAMHAGFGSALVLRKVDCVGSYRKRVPASP